MSPEGNMAGWLQSDDPWLSPTPVGITPCKRNLSLPFRPTLP